MARMNGIDHAIEAAGGSSEFMAAMGIKRRTFFKWKAGDVPLHVLCPAVWPAPATEAA